MKEVSCCFTGHRELPENLLELERRLRIQVVELIQRGICQFYVGGAKGFDQLTAKTILQMKQQYPCVRLVAVLPYPLRQECPADEVIVLSEEYYRGCLHVRNRYLVDHAAICVCYKRKESGGTAYTVRYAEKKGLEIISL